MVVVWFRGFRGGLHFFGDVFVLMIGLVGCFVRQALFAVTRQQI
jgi:hypothetical protein